MNKYIYDSIKNNIRSVTKELTRPQKKAVSEIVRGLFTAGKPILRHLAQDENKLAKKQAEKYSYHLGNINITDKVDELSLKKAQNSVRKYTIIAYDLTDIAKEASKKMEKIARVFDGSKRRTTNGFILHGVGINGILVRFQVHDGDEFTQNQIRKEIIKKISKKLNKKGIWVFDRGNDDKQFFKVLRQELKVHFIVRVKSDRQVVIKKTGDKIQVRNLKQGKYRIYLMNKNNNNVDMDQEYTLVISNHLDEDKEPIRLIHSLKYEWSKNRIVTMYLERWGVENIFKTLKSKFELEKIRVLKWQKFVNFIALIQLAVLVSTITFQAMRQLTNEQIIGALLRYKKFIKMKTLEFNLTSFITFMQDSLKPLIHHSSKPPPDQLSLLPRRCLEKLGSF